MVADETASGFQPEIVLLYCRQALAPGTRPAQGLRAGQGFKAKLVVLPCSSKMEVPHLLRILEQGADAVQVLACPPKTCRFLVGNNRAEKRMAYARGLLEQVGMEPERLALERGSGLDLEGLMELAGRRAELVGKMGPNPMKGDNRQ